jgi:hypothetical protein
MASDRGGRLAAFTSVSRWVSSLLGDARLAAARQD